MYYWYASLYVVVQSFRNLKLIDPRINALRASHAVAGHHSGGDRYRDHGQSGTAQLLILRQVTPRAIVTMYDIAATVTTATPTELKVTGNWPVDWLQAPGFRSIEIQRKLLTSESLGSPLVAVREEEILGNRANWPNLQLGDRVIVRCFFPGESR